MTTPVNRDDDRKTSDEDYKLRDAADNKGIVPDDALQKVNPAAAERITEDHDPHNVAKANKQYDTSVTKR
ncbi:hypothetical protein [Psychrobacter urativorans]|uniref:hypothetical protein n=1 Tax=Psychrobacter urativorans TaxID=45610 RepID=UPI003BB5589E